MIGIQYMTIFFGKMKKIILVSGDLIILYLSLWLTLALRYGMANFNDYWQQHFWPFTIIYLVWLIIFFIGRLYELSGAENNLTVAASLIKVFIVSAVIGVAFFYFIPIFGITPKRVLFLDIILAAILFFIWRRVYNFFVRSPILLNNLLFIGVNDQVEELAKKIMQKPQLGYRLVAVIADKKNDRLPETVEQINSDIASLNLSQLLEEKN